MGHVHRTRMLQGIPYRLFALVSYISVTVATAVAAPPRLSLIHFDVNTGDATLIDSSDGHGVLIDAGDKDHGLNPIKEFLDRATRDGHLVSLDYAIVTHYDPRRITSSSY